MKTLILMRHAKAADYWDDWGRPLSTKGKIEAQKISEEILKHPNFLPEYVICSEADRTKQTFEIFTNTISKKDLKTQYVQTLYHGSLDDLLAKIEETDPQIQKLMIVGHNPLLSEFASFISKKHIALETANAVLLTGDSQKGWNGLRSEVWKLESILKPS